MSNAVKCFAKRAAAAAIFVGVAVSGSVASAGAASVLAAKQTETIYNPNAMPGCWTDNGYGRFTSCDAG